METSPLLARRDRMTGKTQFLLPHSNNVAKYAARFCKPIGLENLGCLAGLLHDCGKAGDAFQLYIRTDAGSLRGTVPHAFCGARYCFEVWGMSDDIRGMTAQWMAAAIGGHHGFLPDVTGVDASDGLHRRAWPEKPADYEQAVGRFLAECVSAQELDRLFEKAQSEVERLVAGIGRMCGEFPAKGRRKAYYFLFGLVQRYVFSALVDADRYDAYLFEAGGRATPWAEDGPPWVDLARRLDGHVNALPRKKGIDIRRQEISEQCRDFCENGCGIYRLSVPTGAGKTFSVMRYALHCAARTGKSHIFYIAPYRTILEQNASDIRDALQLLSDDTDLLLEHHGDVVMPPEGSEELAQHELLAERFSSAIILTTAVQFLNMLFDGRSFCARRMHQLANSVILLDEFQSMPIRCTYMLNAALDFLARFCGCSVVLCTATQPESEEWDVPLLFGQPEQMTENLDDIFAAFRRTNIVDWTGKGPLSAEQLATLSCGQAESRKTVLLILNTKSAAQAVFRALQQKTQKSANRIPLYYLSTNLCAQHRIDRIRQIRECLAPEDPQPLICVSTQLIEAGVNLSFQCVIRSLSGLDSVAQAAGRCNRHAEAPCRDVFLVLCAEENLSYLPDIRAAQQAAQNALADFSSDPGRFGNDLLTPSLICRYYHYYYRRQAAQLCYPLDPKQFPELAEPANLFDLLSVNSSASRFCAEHRRLLPRHPMHQAFETAGKLFEAIDSKGIDAVVPYADGKRLIGDIGAAKDPHEARKLLRQAQRYLVHLFGFEKAFLENAGALYFLPEPGIYVLKEEFYEDTLGVQNRPKPMEFLDC